LSQKERAENARMRDSSEGEPNPIVCDRKSCKKICLSFFMHRKKTKEGCNRGNQDGSVYSERDGKGTATL